MDPEAYIVTYTYYIYNIHTHKTPWKMLAITLKQQNRKENADLDFEACAHAHSDIHNIYTQNPMETADRDPKATESQENADPDSEARVHTHTNIYTHKPLWKMLTMILKQHNHKENADTDSEATNTIT